MADNFEAELLTIELPKARELKAQASAKVETGIFAQNAWTSISFSAKGLADGAQPTVTNQQFKGRDEGRAGSNSLVMVLLDVILQVRTGSAVEQDARCQLPGLTGGDALRKTHKELDWLLRIFGAVDRDGNRICASKMLFDGNNHSNPPEYWVLTDHLVINRIKIVSDNVEVTQLAELTRLWQAYGRIILPSELQFDTPYRSRKSTRRAVAFEESHAIAIGPMRDATVSTPEIQNEQVPSGLKDEICSFDAFIQDKTDGFVGRSFVFEAIEEFRKNVSSGYYLIRGEPGIGKSAIISELIKREDCIHHFNIATSGINTTRLFLRNICARLISRYRLRYDRLPDDASDNGLFFSKLLREVQSALPKDAKLLLTIDALDEVSLTGHPVDANVLFLPPALPDKVHIVLTTRPLHDVRLQVSRLTPLELDRDNKGHLEDVTEYVDSYLSHDGVRAWMAAQELSESGFVEQLLDKSERNFMYLHYMLPSIADGTLADYTLDSLPQGLIAYYHAHWANMMNRDPTIFSERYQPVVCALAAAEVALTLDEIAEAASLDVREVVPVVHQWQQFLYPERREDGQVCYRIYHASFKDFLRNEVGLKPYHQMLGMTVLKKSPRYKKP